MKTIKNFDLWHNTEKFRDEYKSKFGKEPYVNPPIALKWAEASQVSKDDQDAALARKEIFKSWFLKEIVSSPDAIIVLPLSDSEPEYRDKYAEYTPIFHVFMEDTETASAVRGLEALGGTEISSPSCLVAPS
jgi:hypothetical protein